MPTEAVGALQEACCGAVAVCACACLLTVCMLRDPAPKVRTISACVRFPCTVRPSNEATVLLHSCIEQA